MLVEVNKGAKWRFSKERFVDAGVEELKLLSGEPRFVLDLSSRFERAPRATRL